MYLVTSDRNAKDVWGVKKYMVVLLTDNDHKGEFFLRMHSGGTNRPLFVNGQFYMATNILSQNEIEVRPFDIEDLKQVPRFRLDEAMKNPRRFEVRERPVKQISVALNDNVIQPFIGHTFAWFQNQSKI